MGPSFFPGPLAFALFLRRVLLLIATSVPEPKAKQTLVTPAFQRLKTKQIILSNKYFHKSSCRSVSPVRSVTRNVASRAPKFLIFFAATILQVSDPPFLVSLRLASGLWSTCRAIKPRSARSARSTGTWDGSKWKPCAAADKQATRTGAAGHSTTGAQRSAPPVRKRNVPRSAVTPPTSSPPPPTPQVHGARATAMPRRHAPVHRAHAGTTSSVASGGSSGPSHGRWWIQHCAQSPRHGATSAPATQRVVGPRVPSRGPATRASARNLPGPR